MNNRARRFLLLFIVSALVFNRPAPAADPLADFASRVKKIQLKNGLRFIFLERPETPTVSFVMYIRTGGIEDELGKSGLAHMFEHMLFKGTKTVGTNDYAKEKKLLDEMDKRQAALQQELDKNLLADPAKVAELSAAVEEIEMRHQAFVLQEEYWVIYTEAGAQDLNASTGYDFTDYTVSLPANQVKLWMVMEADRLQNPVLREFYKERSVVMEERRMRVDTTPQGKLWENFLAAAYKAHPYGRPIVGWESDITRITRADAEDFFKKHYDVSRLVFAIVGGFKIEDVEPMVRHYFEKIPSNPQNSRELTPVEPLQEGERRVRVNFDARPSLIVGFHRGDMMDRDNAALEAAGEILGEGRTSRFYQTIVEKERIGQTAWANSAGPGERDPSLFLIGGAPRAPHTPEELEKALLRETEKLMKEGPTPRELEKVKNNMEADVIKALSSNIGLANQLAYYEAIAGDWKILLKQIDQLRAVTADDIKAALAKIIKPENKTVGILEKKK